MEKKIRLRFYYVIEGHTAAGNVDTYFYSQLPDMDAQVLDAITGRPATDITTPEQKVTVRGTAAASSAAIAGIIRKYLQARSHKIVIAGATTDKQIKFEGPGLKADEGEISAMIDRLADENGGDELDIKSTY